eukprot:CAMPEP_0204125060 /NCGR_PEP_ID=MMETSP0361-20130328/10210_1 /ASSEMBLY_ACC=CAM_ASM_000343 /TAXON_ID=268821 /ORGANISM="Scrippsiella Hangoei, Strain SHTV-5" /LENGTH=294 /DNA_ID=CAMNT_0051076723 /DNA_START=14 /DNA_END=894 /DNA_ORIENTATION=+
MPSQGQPGTRRSTNGAADDVCLSARGTRRRVFQCRRLTLVACTWVVVVLSGDLRRATASPESIWHASSWQCVGRAFASVKKPANRSKKPAAGFQEPVEQARRPPRPPSQTRREEAVAPETLARYEAAPARLANLDEVSEKPVLKAAVEGPGGWFASAAMGVASAFVSLASASAGGLANVAAEMTVDRAIDMSKPLLARHLGCADVTTDSPIEKNYGNQAGDGMVYLTFDVNSDRGGGRAKLVAAVVPGGDMEIRSLQLDGRLVSVSDAPALEADASPEGARASPRVGVIDVDAV